jgi:hypothetical protein
MTILLYTDASTKNGASCWAFKTSLSDEITTGIALTTNTAAIETLAIIMGLGTLPLGSEVMVVCDFLGAVKTITNRVRYKSKRNNSDNSIYRDYRGKLLELCPLYKLDALWVASNCPNRHHQDVDQASKLVLQEYLKTVK